MSTNGHPNGSRSRRFWIDLDNTPHVPLFVPIVQELEARGYSVFLTARDAFQVRALADRVGLKYVCVGHHYGKHKIFKVAGLCIRALQLLPTVLRNKPNVALSHGSRSQLLVCAVLRIPSIVMTDYEFTKAEMIHPTWVMAPEVIPNEAIKLDAKRILKYPGIKEDVYVPTFKPDQATRASLGLKENDIVVTVRPPADEAHYHNPESEKLFGAVIGLLGSKPDVKVVLLPRNPKQAARIRRQWPGLFTRSQILIPEHAVDGLNLLWFSDLAISGGGTMNREAAALHVPVYSIFRGRIGAVDQYLADQGRLVLLKSDEDVRTKIRLARRHRPASPEKTNKAVLTTIVNEIVKKVESIGPPGICGERTR